MGVGVTGNDMDAKMGVIEEPREGELDREEDTEALTVPPPTLAVTQARRVTKVEALINRVALAGTVREMEDERQRVIDGELLGLLVGDGCAEAKEESVGKRGVGEAVKGLEKDGRKEALPKGV